MLEIIIVLLALQTFLSLFNYFDSRRYKKEAQDDIKFIVEMSRRLSASEEESQKRYKEGD